MATILQTVFISFIFHRDYVTYMLTLVVLYLLFPAFTIMSCYDDIYKYFKKIHNYKVNVLLSKSFYF